jgi:tetratricopeptide (TPR) repeat protein
MIDAITKPLARVVDAAQTFVAERDVRLLHVITTEALRIATIRHIVAEELHSENRCPFLILEAPAVANGAGWGACADELRADMEELRALHEKAGDHGIEIRSMPREARCSSALGRFGVELRAALECVSAPIEGLVIVLAPIEVGDAKQWAEDVAALVGRKDLARARWVIVDIEDPICRPAAEALGEAAITVDARVAGADIRAGIEDMLASVASAPPGARGMRLVGAAGPDELPPPRKTRPAPPTPEQAQALADAKGVPAASLQVEPMHKLRSLVVSAAAALARGDAQGAVAKQREARSMSLGMGLRRVAVMMALVLGGYAIQAGASQTAVEIFREARAEAEAEKLPELAAQAQMAIGASLLVQKKSDDAAFAFAEAGGLAATMGSPIMAIEGYRMCGQLLAAKGDHEHASQAFCRALEIADDTTTIERGVSSAPQAARALAALCRAHALEVQATSLEQQAIAMEQLQDYDTDLEREEEEKEPRHARKHVV